MSEGDSEDGDNYFVSMTDMMVGVLFIFIIMLMAFALDYRTKTDVQVDAIAEARDVAKRLEALETTVRDQVETIDRSRETRSRMLRDIQERLSQEGVQVKLDEDNGILRLTEDAVRFEANRSDLDEVARSNVAKIARTLRAALPNYIACYRSAEFNGCRNDGATTIETVFIEGHTDVTGVRAQDERDRRNWQLSAERSVSTYREMIAASPDLRALRNKRLEEVISVSGYSSTRPIDPGDSKDAWSRNRRIDFRFVMEFDGRERLTTMLTTIDDMKVQINRLVKAGGG